MNYTIKATIKIIGARDGLKPEHVREKLQDVYHFWGGDIDEVDAEVFPSQVNFRVVKIDETRAWRDDFKQYGPIYGLFFYDPNEVTYLCEVTPSHYLYWIEDFSDFDGDVPEDIQDDIFTAGVFDDQNIYIHCHSVPVHFQEDEFEWEEDDTYDNVAERAMEHYRGNTPYNAKGVGRARSSKR